MSVYGTKKTIAEAAALELVARGYAGTSMAQIAKRLGLTKGALTYHFPAKADFATFFITALRCATSQAKAYTTEQYPTCGAQRLLLHFLLMNSWHTTEPPVAAGMALLGDNASPAVGANEVIQDWMTLSVEALKLCEASDKLRPTTSLTEAAEMFLITNLGAGLFERHVRTNMSDAKPLRFVRLALTAIGIPNVDEYAENVLAKHADKLPALNCTWLEQL